MVVLYGPETTATRRCEHGKLGDQYCAACTGAETAQILVSNYVREIGEDSFTNYEARLADDIAAALNETYRRAERETLERCRQISRDHCRQVGVSEFVGHDAFTGGDAYNIYREISELLGTAP